MNIQIPEKLRKFIPGKKLGIGLGLGAVLLLGGTAIAAAGRTHADANGDGIVTRSEQQAMTAQRFTMMDVNKDGKLDTADRAARGGANFTQIDADKNGQISQTEFDAARMQRLDAMGGDRRNGRRGMGERGMRDSGSMGHGGMGHGGMGRGTAALAAMADSNKDGAINQAEFNAMAQRRFDAVDTDKNGQITTTERVAARVMMRDRLRAAAPSSPAAAPATPTPAPK